MNGDLVVKLGGLVLSPNVFKENSDENHRPEVRRHRQQSNRSHHDRRRPAERLAADAEAIVQRFRESSSVVVQSARKAIAGGLDKPFDEALRHAEDVYLNQLLNSDDASEGLRAVKEKRKPEWKNK